MRNFKKCELVRLCLSLARIFHPAAEKCANARYLLNIPGLLKNDNVLPTPAERALAPISSSSCGIGSIINSWAIDSIANPHLNNDLGTIIAFPSETFGLARIFHPAA